MQATSSSDSDEPHKGKRKPDRGESNFRQLAIRQRKIRADWGEVRDFLRRLPVSLSQRNFSVILLSDSAMRRYNKQYRNQNHATDVLSFPVSDVSTGESNYLGDIFISVETASKNAKRYGNRLAEEMKLLILHGVLHLQGYDHETDSGEMAKAERKWSQRLGLGECLCGRVKKAARLRQVR